MTCVHTNNMIRLNVGQREELSLFLAIILRNRGRNKGPMRRQTRVHVKGKGLSHSRRQKKALEIKRKENPCLSFLSSSFHSILLTLELVLLETCSVLSMEEEGKTWTETQETQNLYWIRRQLFSHEEYSIFPSPSFVIEGNIDFSLLPE